MWIAVWAGVRVVVWTTGVWARVAHMRCWLVWSTGAPVAGGVLNDGALRAVLPACRATTTTTTTTTVVASIAFSLRCVILDFKKVMKN